MTERPNYQAPALERGLEIIERMAAHDEPMSLSDLGRLLKRSRSELFRMVVVLERGGYLTRGDDDRFALTQKLFDIAMQAPPQRLLLEAALPIMQQLTLATQQSCHLSLPSGADMVVAARVESPDMWGFSLRVGYRRRLNHSTSGRVLYAFQSPTVRAAWRALTAGTEEDKRWSAVDKDINEIKRLGYDISPSFYVNAVTDIAAPVLSRQSGFAVAALAIPFIVTNTTDMTLYEVAGLVTKSAQAISEALSI